jgi:hypothetical protein
LGSGTYLLKRRRGEHRCAAEHAGSQLQVGWLATGKASCRGEGESAERGGRNGRQLTRHVRVISAILIGTGGTHLASCRWDVSGSSAPWLAFGSNGYPLYLSFRGGESMGSESRGRATGWPAAKLHAAFASASGFCQLWRPCRRLSAARYLFAFWPFRLPGTARQWGWGCGHQRRRTPGGCSERIATCMPRFVQSFPMTVCLS